MDLRFCPTCGMRIDPEPGSKNGRPLLTCAKCGFIYYNSPKPCVGAVIANNGKVLLIRRANLPYRDFWDFPGGFLDFNEHPEIGLKREVSEELGVEVAVSRLVGLYMDFYRTPKESTLNIYYTCNVTKGEIAPQEEVAEVRWFELTRLPKRLAFNHIESVLEDWQNGKK